ncbi:MAG: cysteine desulfurase [Clostridiales bacterium]|nr:cysteine desulfurase [Clostridiales bacterium]
MSVYLDNAAATVLCPEAAEAVLRSMKDDYANPSSVHTMGRAAKKTIDNAREVIADALGADPGEIFFTSGGTEADNWAILGAAELKRHIGKHIISSPTEHDAVIKPLELLESRGYDICKLKPTNAGTFSEQELEAAVREDTVLVSLMMVNNETGNITSIRTCSEALKRRGSRALMHTDAVQAFLKIPFEAQTTGADLISISSHKIHGPKGIGALYVKRGINLPPIIYGGGQEGGKRSGTEAAPLIAGFAAAVTAGKKVFSESVRSMNELRQNLIDELSLKVPGIMLIGGGAPHIICLSIPGYKGEVILNYLDARGIYISRASACKRGRRSHVLQAMGLDPEIIDGSIRVSLSGYTNKDETRAFAEALECAVRELAHGAAGKKR